MWSSRLLVSTLAAFTAVSATAAPSVLYDGSALPTAQGWTRIGSEGTQTVRGDGTTEFKTVNSTSDSRLSEMDLYSYATGATNFIVSIRLEVLSSSYNPSDAALTFSAFGDAGFVASDRSVNLMIDDGALLWGDMQGGPVASAAGGFHEYAFRYLNGTLDVFIDADFAAIEAGAATAVLSRSVLQPAKTPGTIVFGDATNDRDFDSNYVVDRVSFRDLDATAQVVPEPGGLALAGLGLAVAGVLSRRRATAPR